MTIGTIVAVRINVTAIEVQVGSVRAINRTTPIVAVVTHIVEGTVVVVSVTGKGPGIKTTTNLFTKPYYRLSKCTKCAYSL